ncbi:hypothetical protein [Sphingomonas sp.]|uniref:hypothetical protein n=1 Tax=Sphingomonas sp. TaxID=28214 RepID=UPI0025E00090|nr:hypothetical protein [Sphingomonas sp.]
MTLLPVPGQAVLVVNAFSRKGAALFEEVRDKLEAAGDFRGREMTLDTRPHHHVSIDGQLLARTPVMVRVAQRAIEVVVPGVA